MREESSISASTSTKPPSSRRSGPLGLLALGAVALLAAGWQGAKPIGPAPADGDEQGPKVVGGEFAPDFELPRLRFGENEEGEPIGIIDDRDTFKLSSLRGQRPVCIVMSSYT